MRAATFVVVLAIHAVFFFLFAVLRGPARSGSEVDAPAATLIFLPEEIRRDAVKAVESVSAAPAPARAVRRAAPETPPSVSSAPEPPAESSSISAMPAPTPAPDWRAEAQVAANNVLEAERRKQEHPSLLEPHDFSGATPGSTDTSKPKFGWNHARTHRLEGSPGALVVNVNDRCAIALLFIFPFAVCKIGTMPAQGNLFEHLHDLPDPKQPELP